MEFNETAARAKMREVATKSRAILEGNHDYTPAQAAEVLERLSADAKSASDVISGLEKARALAGMSGEAAPVATDNAPAPRSIGEAVVVKSVAYRDAKSRVGQSSSFHASFETKASPPDLFEGTNDGDVMSGNAGAIIRPNFLPGIVDIRQRPLVVADLFSQGTTESPIVVYVQELSRSYGPDAPVAPAATGDLNVLEGGTKQQSTTELGRVNEPVVKIAHYVTVSDEMMEDGPALMAFLNTMLVTGLRLREQQQLLNGSGTLPQLRGVLNRTGLQTAISVTGGSVGAPFVAAQATDLMDSIHTQISNIRWNAFCEPDTILVNPSDWNTLRLAKDANDQYMGGGPFTAAYGNGPYTNLQSLWGFRVVVTPELAAGTVLIGAFAEGGQIFRRSGIRIEMTNSDQADFINNLVKVRAEERLALAVYRPGCFGRVNNAV